MKNKIKSNLAFFLKWKLLYRKNHLSLIAEEAEEKIILKRYFNRLKTKWDLIQKSNHAKNIVENSCVQRTWRFFFSFLFHFNVLFIK